MYANLTDTSEVVEIDANAAIVLRRWSTAPCKQPVSMAIDTAHHRLFSGCRSGLMAVSDYRAAKVVATVPIGTGVTLQGTCADPVLRPDLKAVAKEKFKSVKGGLDKATRGLMKGLPGGKKK